MISGTVDFACATPRPQPAVAGGRVEGKGFAVAVSGARTDVFSDGTVIVAASGSPRFPQPGAPTPAAGWAERYRIHGFDAPREVRGTFAVAIVDLAQRRALLAVDRFAIEPLCHADRGPVLSFATRADRVPLDAAPELDPQAIFNYLYFHVIPAPRTIFRDVARLRSGHALRFENDRASSAPFWRPRFVEDSAAPLDELKAEFRGLVREAVAREASGAAVGCFLSGGTDSSTVAGMVGQVTGAPPRTYSIGFDQAGYDEMAYARIAARHFGAVHHEHYVTARDLVEGMPKVAAFYDQPFGNSSAVPAFYCATMARGDGIERLLAGDGGDELFGGNTRYAKQRVFEAYSALPRALRQGAVEPILLGTSVPSRVPGLRKVASYVGQARVPMPERIEQYNLLLRFGLGEVLSPELMAQIDPAEPATAQRKTYSACAARSIVNRMLAYDWVYTLADNDLPKVVGSATLAGVAVAFPLLADEIVDFSLRLPPRMKVKGLKLRWFFKEALRGVLLPEEIIAKAKHGFGLPFGPWLVKEAGLRTLVFDSMRSLRRRGIVRSAFLDDVLERRLAEHPGYYGEMVWILTMLELWLASRASTVRGPIAPAAAPCLS